MAEGKVVGVAQNLIKFKTDHQSLTKVLADIKKVKEAMKSVQAPMQKMRAQTTATKKQVNQDRDWLIVQRQINKNKKEELKTDALSLKHQERKIRNTERQTKAIQKQQQEARKAAVSGLTVGSGMKANSTLFAQMLKQEDAYNKRRDSILAKRDAARLGRRINRADIEAKATGRSNAVGLRFAERASSMTGADRFGLVNRFGNRAGNRFDSIATAFRSGSIDARMYRQQVSALRRDLSQAANAQRGFNGTLKDMRSMLVQATASYTAFAGLMGIANVGKSVEGYKSGMQMAFGSKEEAEKQYEWLSKITRNYGTSFTGGLEGYSKLAVAGSGKLATKDIQSLFEGYNAYTTASGTSTERSGLGIQAMVQMISKGKISAEEFRQQMAEQVIGSDKAFRMAVEETIGRKLKKGELEDMMQKGQLDPEKIMPLVGKYFMELAKKGGALTDKLFQLSAVQERMTQSFREWTYSIYEGGLVDGLKTLYKTLDDIFWFMKQGDSFAGGFLKGFLDSLNSSIVFVYNNALKLYYMLKYDLGMSLKGEWFGTTAYWLMLAATFNTIYKTLSLMLTGGLISKLAKLGGIGGAAAATTAEAGAVTAALTPLGAWFATLGTQLAAIAGPLGLIAGAITGTWWTQNKYGEMSPRQQASYQLQQTLAGTSAGGVNSSLQLPNTNPYSQIMQAVALMQYNQAITQANRSETPIKLEVTVKDSVFSNAIEIGFQNSMGKVVNSMMPASTQAPSLLIK